MLHDPLRAHFLRRAQGFLDEIVVVLVVAGLVVDELFILLIRRRRRLRRRKPARQLRRELLRCGRLDVGQARRR